MAGAAHLVRSIHQPYYYFLSNEWPGTHCEQTEMDKEILDSSGRIC